MSLRYPPPTFNHPVTPLHMHAHTHIYIYDYDDGKLGYWHLSYTILYTLIGLTNGHVSIRPSCEIPR